jgi:hypothetical protein
MMSHSPATMRTTPEINVARISELSEKVLSGTKVSLVASPSEFWLK